MIERVPGSRRKQNRDKGGKRCRLVRWPSTRGAVKDAFRGLQQDISPPIRTMLRMPGTLVLCCLVFVSSGSARAAEVHFLPDFDVTNVALGARSVFSVDIDGDGDLDLVLVSVNDDVLPYAREIQEHLQQNLFRAEIDLTGESFNKKIRNAVTRKIPNIWIIGGKELDNRTVTWRRYCVNEQKTLDLHTAYGTLESLRVDRMMDNFEDVDLPVGE